MGTSSLDISSPCIRTPGELPAPSPAQRPTPRGSRVPVGEAASPFFVPSDPGDRGNLGYFLRARAAHHPLLHHEASARSFCTDTHPTGEGRSPSISTLPPPGACRQDRGTATFVAPLPILCPAGPARRRPSTPARVGAHDVGLVAIPRRAVARRAALLACGPPAPPPRTAGEARPKEPRSGEKEMTRRMDPPKPHPSRTAPKPPAPASRHAATGATRAGGRGPSGEASRALPVLLAVLQALAPVSRASFLALRAVTGLPYPALLGALVSLREADLVDAEPVSTGPSRVAFRISAAGRAVLATEPEPSVIAPSRLRHPSAILAALAGCLLARPARHATREGRKSIEADGEETPETAPDQPQEAPHAQGAPGRPPGPAHQPGDRRRDDGLREKTDPGVLVWARGVRDRNGACRDAHRNEGRVPDRLAALFDEAPPFPSDPKATRGEPR